MINRSFIVYPKSKISLTDNNIEIIDVPIKSKLKAFITGYIEDYKELPSIDYVQSAFNISKQDAEMALSIYGGSL